MRGEAFALTSLQDRSFRSTIAFFFTEELVLCAFDVFHALRMVFEPGRRYADVATWCTAVRAMAESVVVIPDRDIASVRITLRMMQDQLLIAYDRDGVSAPEYRSFHRKTPAVHRFQVLERADTAAATQHLVRRFGARFELAATHAHTSARRLAPWFAR